MDNIDNPWNFHQCKLCHYKTRFLHCILRHVRLHRTRTKSHRFACDLHSPEKYQCEKCDFQSDFKVLLTEHFDTVHTTKQTEHYPNPVRYCENCDFQTYSSLVLLHHNCCNGNGVPVKEEKLIKCENGNIYSNELTNASDKGKEFFHCSNCPYQTIYSKSLKFHVIRMHTSSEPIIWFKCKRLAAKKQCSYKTTTKHDLRKHMLATHTQPAKPIRCKFDQCPYEAIRKTSLRLHMRQEHWYLIGQHMLRRHTKIIESKELKYFTCAKCSYKSTRRGRLRDHILWEHTYSEQIDWIKCEIKCELCSYRSKHKDDLCRHILTQHMETANAQVFYEGILISRKHTLAAEQINCLKCELCSYKSKHKGDLGRHILTQHIETEKSQVFYEGILISW